VAGATGALVAEGLVGRFFLSSLLIEFRMVRTVLGGS
jgi:hypothetical protein